MVTQSPPTNLAEIKLFAHNVSLYGFVTEMTDDNIELRLLTLPAHGSMLDPGTEASVLCVSGSAVVSVVAAVADRHDQELHLVRRRSADRNHRREGHRVPCDIPVEYRAIRTEGDFGPWREGRIVDLGKGGVGMVLEPASEVPNRMEVKFHLPSPSGDDVAEADRADRVSGGGMLDRMAEGTAIRAAARAEYVRVGEDGRARVGVAFAMIGPADRARLACFLECATHAAL